MALNRVSLDVLFPPFRNPKTVKQIKTLNDQDWVSMYTI